VNALEIERATILAWPAAETEEQDGWFLLAGSGVTGRVNAVWPLEWRGLDVGAAIENAERWYAARNMPPRFKLTDAAYEPGDLPLRLAALGYAPTKPTLVMMRPLTNRASTHAYEGVSLAPQLPPAFDRALVESTPDAAELAERRAIALRAPAPAVFAVRPTGGAALAIGMSAIAGELAGVFLMRTVPAARRQGHARHILRALLEWAGDHHATSAFLQVDADNTPAVSLYEREGFTTLTAYRFWRKPA
jgi:ribosomal protein S18 acetylase RimI-like enzyme